MEKVTVLDVQELVLPEKYCQPIINLLLSTKNYTKSISIIIVSTTRIIYPNFEGALCPISHRGGSIIYMITGGTDTCKNSIYIATWKSYVIIFAGVTTCCGTIGTYINEINHQTIIKFLY